MFVAFRDKDFNYYKVSKNQLDYPDFLSMEEQGYYIRVIEGTRKEVEDFLEETVPNYV